MKEFKIGEYQYLLFEEGSKEEVISYILKRKQIIGPHESEMLIAKYSGMNVNCEGKNNVQFAKTEEYIPLKTLEDVLANEKALECLRSGGE